MTRSGRFRTGFALAVLAPACLVGSIAAATVARAQASGCEKLTVMLKARQSLVGVIEQSVKNKDAQAACGAFTKLTSNGTEALKWMAANKDWCHIPDQFFTHLKADNDKAQNFRGQACKAAAKVEEAKKNGGANGLLGGNGLTGEMKIPSGAL